MKTLLEIALVLAIEVRAGRLKREHFPSLEASELVRRLKSRKSKDEESVADQISRRYPGVSVDKSPLGFDQLQRLLFEGWASPTDVSRDLDEGPYFAKINQPAWLIAWRGWDVSDQDFADALSKIELQFSERKFDSTCEMLHIFGLRFFFSKIGSVKDQPDEIAAQCIACLDEQFARVQIDDVDFDKLFRAGDLYCSGHQVMSGDTKEFQTVFSHFEHLVGLAKELRLPQHGQTLLEHLKKAPLLFFQSLCANNERAAEFYNVPVLATIPVDQFATELLNLGPSAQGTIFSTLKERYGSGLLNKELRSEADWLRNLNEELLRRAPTLTEISRYRLGQRLGSCVEPFLKALSTPKAP